MTDAHSCAELFSQVRARISKIDGWRPEMAAILNEAERQAHQQAAAPANEAREDALLLGELKRERELSHGRVQISEGLYYRILSALSYPDAPASEAGKFWLSVQNPGEVPALKGPFETDGIAATLREFMAGNPIAYINIITLDASGAPLLQHGPQWLQIIDGRSMSTGRKHNQRVREAEASLRSALRSALEPFATFADHAVDDEGWAGTIQQDRIADWFGPSDFRRARATLCNEGANDTTNQKAARRD